jgi:ATP-dependent RNA helicase RhlB
MKFDDLDLAEPIRAGLRDLGFSSPTPIQEKSLPYALKGEDVAGQAQTGTGKTAAFLIAIFSRLLSRPNRKPGLPRALVLAPTRELALQIFRDAEELGKHTGLTMTVLFGGMDWQKQRESLETGADLVIATPGRLMDYHRQKILILNNVEIVVVDEADRMFDMGFIKDIRYILHKLPPFKERQSMLFSATLSLDVMELAYEHMNLPVEVSVESERITAEGIEQHLVYVTGKEKFHTLLRILAAEQPKRAIIFSNTKGGVEKVARQLAANDYKVAVLSGDIPQPKRLRIVNDFKEGKLQIVVATDVASRGLHVSEITHVFNYDLPQDAEDYVHRIGRTARAGALGKSYALVDEDSAFYLEAVQKYIEQKLPVMWPEDLPEVTEKRAPPMPRSERPAPRRDQGGQSRRPPQRGRRTGR